MVSRKCTRIGRLSIRSSLERFWQWHTMLQAARMRTKPNGAQRWLCYLYEFAFSQRKFSTNLDSLFVFYNLQMGIRYGTVADDLYTSYLLQSEGRKSVYCKHPCRAMFCSLHLLSGLGFQSPSMPFSPS